MIELDASSKSSLGEEAELGDDQLIYLTTALRLQLALLSVRGTLDEPLLE